MRADRMNQLVEEERRQVGVILLYIHHHGLVVRAQAHGPWAAVVEVGERDAIFGANRRADDELVDVIELIPVLVARLHVAANACMQLRNYYVNSMT